MVENEVAPKQMRFCQADELVKALHIMNNVELKFMFYALSKRNIGEDKIVTTFDDVLSHLKIEYGGKQTQLYKRAIESIIKKSVISVEMCIDRLPEYKDKNYKSTDTVIVSGALMGATLYPDNKLEIDIFPKFIPMLDDLRHDYTWIYLEQMARLSGKYSPRIYEWCKMQLKDKDECHFVWYLDTDSKEAPGVRQWLNIGDKYKEYKAFNRRVLKPSFDEINKNTSDITVEVKPLRNGIRTPIYALDMHIEAKHKTNKIQAKKEKRNAKKPKIELPDKFKEKKVEMSADELNQQTKELLEKLKNNEL